MPNKYSASLSDKVLDSRLLRRLERYFKLDLRYFIQNYVYLASAQVVTLACGLLLSVAFARLLPKETFGQYSFIFAILAMATITTLPGMGTAIVQAVARGHDRVLIEGTKERFKWSILGVAALLGIGIYYFLNGSALLGKCFIAASLLFPLAQNLETYNSFLQGRKLFGKSAKYRIVVQLVSVIATLLVVYFTRNLILIVITTLLSTSLLRGYYFLVTAKSIHRGGDDKSAISLGRHLSLMDVFGRIVTEADRVIVGIVLGFTDLAVYSIARTIPRGLQTFESPIARLALPKLAELGKEEAYSAVKKKYLYLVLFAAVVSAILILISPYVVTFLYTEKYEASILYMQILLAGLVFSIPTQILNKALFPAQAEVGKLYRFRLIRPSIRLVLLVALGLKFGVLGVVLAVVLTDVFSMVYALKLAGFSRLVE